MEGILSRYRGGRVYFDTNCFSYVVEGIERCRPVLEPLMNALATCSAASTMNRRASILDLAGEHLPASPNMTAPKTVLILCTGNSCRSQMAEALVNHDFGGAVCAISAGTRPQARVSPNAIEALRLAGLPTAGLYPKDIDAVLGREIDLVVTVCDHARDSCPIFPRALPALHLPFHDPHGEPLESFIAVRDDLRARLVPAVRKALGLLEPKSPRA